MNSAKKRTEYLDHLRILACFLVIVNHTNQDVYSTASVHGLTWYVSILYHFLCRMAVPLFLMISGACLLNKRDSWHKVLQRVIRIALLLLIFSTAHYLLHASWTEQPLQILIGYFRFLAACWQQPAAGAYWYLYLYMGLLLLTPFLQAMVQSLKDSDFKAGLIIWLVFGSGVLLLNHYLPGLSPSQDFCLPMASDFVCCMLAGYYICHRAKTKRPGIAALILLFCIVIQMLMCRIEYNFVPEGSLDYMFLDWRIHPSVFMLISAICALYIGKAFSGAELPGFLQPVLRELGACSLPIYLIHSWIVEATRNVIYLPLSTAITAFPAVVLWEFLVFLISALISMGLRRLPGLRKLL